MYCDFAITLRGQVCCPCCGTTREGRQGLCDYCDLHQHKPEPCGCTPCAYCQDYQPDEPTSDDWRDPAPDYDPDELPF